MIPAVFNCCWLNSVPGIFCHQHGFADINFEDIFLSNRIKFQGPLTEQGAIVGFETMNDPSVKWLDKGGHVWCKKLQLDVGWSVVNVVATEVINE